MSTTTSYKLVKNIRKGDIVGYCGATYEINDVEKPDYFGVVLMRTTKRANGHLVSNTFCIVRRVDEIVRVLYEHV
jgi:hypothetical protein